jgi:transcription factor MYB, plant
VVLELQAQFGNKWARISTYLPGRTDNDVKNFWSTRQKRIARLLGTPPRGRSSRSRSRSAKGKAQAPVVASSLESRPATVVKPLHVAAHIARSSLSLRNKIIAVFIKFD